MKLLKDLLYNHNNKNLDISRLASLLAVLTYLGATIWHVAGNKVFDPVAFGAGWTALCAGCGGWIAGRQWFEREATA